MNEVAASSGGAGRGFRLRVPGRKRAWEDPGSSDSARWALRLELLEPGEMGGDGAVKEVGGGLEGQLLALTLRGTEGPSRAAPSLTWRAGWVLPTRWHE